MTCLIDVKQEKSIARLEKQIGKLKEKLAKTLRAAKPQPVGEYVLTGLDGKPLKLSKAFAGKEDLIVIHYMGTFCSYCTLWADEYNGIAEHLMNRAGLLVVSNDPVAKLKGFKKTRGWKFPMASALGSPFNIDMGFADDKGNVVPGFTTFRRGKGGTVLRIAHRYFGPGDDFCGLWHFFDALKDGAAGWAPKFSYK